MQQFSIKRMRLRCRMGNWYFLWQWTPWWEVINVRPFYLIMSIPLLVRWRLYIETYDDVIKWKHFPRYWPFVRGIHRSPVNSPHKGQWHGALMFSLICAWINRWINNREAGDLRRYRAHYDVSVMRSPGVIWLLECQWMLIEDMSYIRLYQITTTLEKRTHFKANISNHDAPDKIRTIPSRVIRTLFLNAKLRKRNEGNNLRSHTIDILFSGATSVSTWIRQFNGNNSSENLRSYQQLIYAIPMNIKR